MTGSDLPRAGESRGATGEDRETRIKRLRIRSWRRGTKEMDLLLGGFADGPAEKGGLPALSNEELDLHEVLMDQNDNDLYLWVSGTTEVPSALQPAIDRVKAFHALP